MPLNKLAYARYNIIDDCLTNKRRPYPGMKDLLAACEEKLVKEFSVSQLQKDIKAMKEGIMGMPAPIKFSKSYNGYYYGDPDFSIKKVPLSSEELQAIHQAADLMKVFSGTRVSQYFTDAVHKIETALKADYGQPVQNRFPIIDIERPSAHKGFQHFEFFAEAAQNRHPVSFVHYSYDKRKFSSVILHTYMLKEFHNRWYVIGHSEKHKEVRTFGIDRIYDPLMLSRTFVEDKNFNADYFLKDLYGVLPLKGRNKQRIVFRVNSRLSNYFQTNPMHHSQQILKYHEYGTIDFSIDVIPTLELLNDFFMHSTKLVVLSPAWIKNELHTMHQNAVNYERFAV
jgi:predicted DNA-binding transcriptional regulator YafY